MQEGSGNMDYIRLLHGGVMLHDTMPQATHTAPLAADFMKIRQGMRRGHVTIPSATSCNIQRSVPNKTNAVNIELPSI